jgi:hypothetical protein
MRAVTRAERPVRTAGAKLCLLLLDEAAEDEAAVQLR